MKRFVILYPDGKYEVQDREIRRNGPTPGILYESCLRADMVIEIDTINLETKVIKNRWGNQGRVVRGD